MMEIGEYVYQGEWQSGTLVNEDGLLDAVHHYPVEGFVHLLTRSGSCQCGPSKRMVETYDGRMVPFYQHTALAPSPQFLAGMVTEMFRPDDPDSFDADHL